MARQAALHAGLCAAVGLECVGGKHVVQLADGHWITAKAVIVATGISWRRLGVARLEALVGSGVFYGAAGSEMRAMEGRHVFVMGAGNSAGQTTLHLARHAHRVTMLVRGDSLGRSMSDYLIREIQATSNITVRLHTEVTEGHGSDQLEALTLCDKAAGRAEQVPAVALFVLIGGEPRTRWLRKRSSSSAATSGPDATSYRADHIRPAGPCTVRLSRSRRRSLVFSR